MMGEIADMIINGEQCHWCGVCFEHPHGYPVACKSCWEEVKSDFRQDKPPLREQDIESAILEQTGVQKAIHKELGEE